MTPRVDANTRNRLRASFSYVINHAGPATVMLQVPELATLIDLIDDAEEADVQIKKLQESVDWLLAERQEYKPDWKGPLSG